jgi:hypothetical protein
MSRCFRGESAMHLSRRSGKQMHLFPSKLYGYIALPRRFPSLAAEDGVSCESTLAQPDLTTTLVAREDED